MSRERDAYHQREREEAEKEAQMIRDYQEQYQKNQEAEWKLSWDREAYADRDYPHMSTKGGRRR